VIDNRSSGEQLARVYNHNVPLKRNETMGRNLLSKLVERPVVAAIALALASSATVCLSGTQEQAKLCLHFPTGHSKHELRCESL